MAEEVHPVEPERLSHGGDLLDEGVHDPQGRIVRVVGTAAPELVVEDDRAPALIGQGCQVLQVVMGQPGPPLTTSSGSLPSGAGNSPTTWYQVRNPRNGTVPSVAAMMRLPV